jgi:hypothetical protein
MFFLLTWLVLHFIQGCLRMEEVHIEIYSLAQAETIRDRRSASTSCYKCFIPIALIQRLILLKVDEFTFLDS